MELLTYKSSYIEEIKQLFTKVFSDSEGQTEGVLIGNLVDDLMTGTGENDLYGFLWSSVICFVLGIPTWLATRRNKKLTNKDFRLRYILHQPNPLLFSIWIIP